MEGTSKYVWQGDVHGHWVWGSTLSVGGFRGLSPSSPSFLCHILGLSAQKGCPRQAVNWGPFLLLPTHYPSGVIRLPDHADPKVHMSPNLQKRRPT